MSARRRRGRSRSACTSSPRTAAGELTLRYDWPVSTGREKVEYNKAGWKLPSFTPAGYYELDPHRMYRALSLHAVGHADAARDVLQLGA